MPIEDPFEKDPLLHEHNVAAVAGGGSGGSITTAIRRHDNNRVDSSGMYSSHFGECTISWRYILVLILAGCNIFTFADLCLLSASVGPAGSDLSSPTARHSAFLAFYAGYIVAALPGGRAAETHGGKKNIIVGMLCWALANIALAVAFPYPTSPWIGVMVGARALQGLAQGIIFPATFHLISTWFPERERTVAMALTLGGLDVGAALGMMLMPTYLVTSGGDPFSSITRSATESGDAEDEGSTASSSLRSAGRIWQAHYYVFAIAGVMLSAAAYKLVSSTPEWHPRISLPEVQHITKDRPKPIGLLDLNQVAAIEWRTLVTHPALLAIYGTHTICCLVFHLALIYLPFLFAERFGIRLKYFVSYMILPSAASVGAAIAGGAICDALIQVGAP
jgi:ACS family sodium-dependent inorganic phosphate cotransporter-like MFS transporter 5